MLGWEDGTACMRDPRISKNPDRRGKGWKGRKERDWEKLAHITVCIFTDTCTFAPWILEKDDYLHRDTFSLSQLVYLLIYFLVLRVYPSLLPFAAYLRLSRRISSPFFFLFPFLFFPFSYSLPPFQILLFLVPPRSGGIVFTLHRDPIVASVKISEFHRNGKREREKSMRRDESSVVFRISFKWRFFRILVVEQDDGILCENAMFQSIWYEMMYFRTCATIILYLSLIEDALISVTIFR